MPGQYHSGSNNFSFARTNFGEVHMCHSRCATVDVYQQVMKTQVDILSTNDLVCAYQRNI